jgi:hypothetical protein
MALYYCTMFLYYHLIFLDEKYKNIRIKNWRIVNVLGTCNLPFGIKIVPFSQAFKVGVKYCFSSLFVYRFFFHLNYVVSLVIGGQL